MKRIRRATLGTALALAVCVSSGLAADAVAPAPSDDATARAAAPAQRESAAARSATGKGPWGNGSYRPRHGQWKDYVLSPRGRTVRPRAVQEVRERGGSITGDAATLLKRDGTTVRLTASGERSTSPLIVLDLGREVSGPLRIQVTDASDTRPELHACYSESLQYAALSTGQNQGQTAIAPGCDTANIWNGFPGTSYTWDSDSHTLPLADAELPALLEDPELRGGYRYVTLFLDGDGWVDVDSVAVHFSSANQQESLRDYQGHFLSSDNKLNKIWYAGAYTVQLNTAASDTAKSWPYETGEGDHADDAVPGADPDTDVIFDGGKRDRIVWQGDLAVQDPTTYVSTYDLSAVENSLTSLASQQLEDGYVPAESQVGPHNVDELRTYGEYVTWFIHNMAVHYQWTGDREYLDQWWPALKSAASWLENQRDETGLIGFEDSGSCGHYGYSECGHETYVNSLYVRNLNELATLATAEGDAALARRYADRSDAVAEEINDQLWDAEAGAYRLSLETPSSHPQDANATAVLTGVASENRSRRALQFLQLNSWTDLGSLTVSDSEATGSQTPFYAPLASWFEVDARLDAPGATDVEQHSGVTLMKRFWGWMLDQDPGSTFWEHVDADGNPKLGQFSSLAHGWASGPTVTLTTKVLGVSPDQAGFKTFEVAPHPGSLSWAEGTVPTPRGTIRVAWTSSGRALSLRVKAPRGTSPSVTAPYQGRGVQITVDGRVVWSGSARSTKARYVDGHVQVDGLGSGKHRVTVRRLHSRTIADLALSPTSSVVSPGDELAYVLTVSGKATKRLAGEVKLNVPDGWVLSRTRIPVSLRSDGKPAQRRYRFFVRVPDDLDSGTGAVRATFRGSGARIRETSRLTVRKVVTIEDFEDGDVDGWSADQNVASVAAVSGFANGPGTPYAGSYALEATSEAVPGAADRSVTYEPSAPMDLGEASVLSLHFDSYGGLPDADSYQVSVALEGSDGSVQQQDFAVTPDSWNALDIDVSSWSGRSAVTQMTVTFSAPGSTFTWGPRFQIDDVQWSN